MTSTTSTSARKANVRKAEANLRKATPAIEAIRAAAQRAKATSAGRQAVAALLATDAGRARLDAMIQAESNRVMAVEAKGETPDYSRLDAMTDAYEAAQAAR